MGDQNQRINEIRKYLECIRIDWHQTNGQAGKLSSAAKFGLILVRSVRRFVNMVNGNVTADILDGSHLRRQSVGILSEKRWPSEAF